MMADSIYSYGLLLADALERLYDSTTRWNSERMNFRESPGRIVIKAAETLAGRELLSKDRCVLNLMKEITASATTRGPIVKRGVRKIEKAQVEEKRNKCKNRRIPSSFKYLKPLNIF